MPRKAVALPEGAAALALLAHLREDDRLLILRSMWRLVPKSKRAARRLNVALPFEPADFTAFWTRKAGTNAA